MCHRTAARWARCHPCQGAEATTLPKFRNTWQKLLIPGTVSSPLGVMPKTHLLNSHPPCLWHMNELQVLAQAGREYRPVLSASARDVSVADCLRTEAGACCSARTSSSAGRSWYNPSRSADRPAVVATHATSSAPACRPIIVPKWIHNGYMPKMDYLDACGRGPHKCILLFL